MRNRSILLLCSLLPIAAIAQTEVRELNWQDFTNSIRKTVIADPVHTGAFTTFQIVNINKFLYKVEIKGTVFELQTPIPTELQTLFRLNATELQQTVENQKAQEGAAIIPEQIGKMKEVKKQIENALTAVVAIAPADKAARDKKEADKSNLESIIDELEKLIRICEEYRTLAETVATNILNLKSSRSELISTAQMDKSVDGISAKLVLITQPSPAMKTNYVKMKQKYAQVEALYSRAAAHESDDTEVKAALKQVRTSLDQIEQADEMIDEESLIGLYSDVDFLYSELQNKNNFTVIAPPVQMSGDLAQYTVKITPSTTRTLGPYRNPMEFLFEIPVKGGVKIDFSVGPILSFGSGARDEKYFLEEINPTNVILRQRANRNVIVPSIGALMHCYPRTGKYRGFGGMFGIGAGFQSNSEITANIFGGLTYVTGKREKLMFSLGVSYLRVDRLKEGQFKVDGQYEAAKINLGDVTEKVYKPSVFFSISYAISQKLEVK